jgi:hypothetical protein
LAFDSILQQVEVGDLVAYNLSGRLALGRVVSINPGPEGRYITPSNFRIRLLAAHGWPKRSNHISKVKYSDSVLKITSRGDFEGRFGYDR